MSGYSLLSASALIACSIIACHGAPDAASEAGDGGAPQEAAGAQSIRGHAGRGGATAAGGKRGNPDETAAGAAGESESEGGSGGDAVIGMAGDAGSASGGTSSGGAAPAPPNEIPADAGASATDCAAGEHATCTVLAEPACEFMAFAGASKALSCGETVAVGTTDCGGCGFVTVELFFDGRYCWQGVPECSLPEYAGKFVYPHLP